MNKQEELKEIEEVLADLEARMAGLRKFVEEEQKKPEYKIGDILLSKESSAEYIVCVTGINKDGEITGDYRAINKRGLSGDVCKEGYFPKNQCKLSYLFS